MMIDQILAITLMNLRSLPARLHSSMVIVVGIAGVVGVLVAILSMAKGFEATLKGTGLADRAIVLRGGSGEEMSSTLSTQQAQLIESKPGIQSSAGIKLAAGETYVIADIRKRANNSEANMPMRGVEPASFSIRDEVKIVEGRNLEFGRFELIAGVGAADQFQGVDIGNALKIRGADWHVVGLFEANGSIYESEVWVDNTVLRDNLKRGGGYNSMFVKLTAPEDLDVLKQALADDPQLETEIIRETTYYSAQSGTDHHNDYQFWLRRRRHHGHWRHFCGAKHHVFGDFDTLRGNRHPARPGVWCGSDRDIGDGRGTDARRDRWPARRRYCVRGLQRVHGIHLGRDIFSGVIRFCRYPGTADPRNPMVLRAWADRRALSLHQRCQKTDHRCSTGHVAHVTRDYLRRRPARPVPAPCAPDVLRLCGIGLLDGKHLSG